MANNKVTTVDQLEELARRCDKRFIDDSKVQASINAALQAAKEAGTFDGNGIVSAILNADYTLTLNFTDDSSYTTPSLRGEKGDPGYTPQKCIDYFDGQDGVSCTHSWNGTTLTVTSASGTSSADLKGEKGDTGEIDYSRLEAHNTDTDAHNDIRLLVSGLTERLNALANSDDTTLDQMAELVAYIKVNRDLIEQITTGKVSVADIVDNLSTNVADKPLSAAQGVALKALIDGITVPTKVSQLENDSKYLTGYTETDPTVPAWAKAESKPRYTAEEVGARPNTWMPTADEVGALPSTTTIPTKTSQLTNDSGFLTSAPVFSVNGKTGAVQLGAGDVSARPNTWTPSAEDVGAVPTSRTVNGKPLSSDINLAASDVGARPNTWTPTAAAVGAGTFAGAVKANASGQTPGTSLLRNSLLTADDTVNPTVEGEIVWVYK